jgi:SAM-dependent methyltransferase
MNIDNSFEELKDYYDNKLNKDRRLFKSSNDEPTPIDCVIEMIDKIPKELWKREKLLIMDACCGNGNFSSVIFHKLLEYHKKKEIMEEIIEFNDINDERLMNVMMIFKNDEYNLKIIKDDYLEYNTNKRYDLIVANPPYARLMEDGRRTSKNHNLIKDFIEKTLSLLKPDGYLLFITPDNWMSYANRNLLIEKITSLQIIHLDIHIAKRYFKKIGSSFTWYIIKNCEYYEDINIRGIWKNKIYEGLVKSQKRRYIPLLYNKIIQTILEKTIENNRLKKFEIKTSSYLHKYTKAKLIRIEEDDIYKFKLIHTPKQIVYSSIPHKYQEGYKVFISTTDKYKILIDNCGMTQSIAFIICKDEEEAKKYKKILEHPLYKFINDICRWGNFNNIRILQQFPIPYKEDIYESFELTKEEISYINDNLDHNYHLK